MAINHDTNPSSPSTTWGWRRVKISQAPQANGTARRKAPRWHGLHPWPRREPLTIKVTYRGGPECWVEIHSRGRIGRYPGYYTIYDVLSDIWQ